MSSVLGKCMQPISSLLLQLQSSSSSLGSYHSLVMSAHLWITVVRSAILLKYRRWRHSKTHWFPIALRLSVGHSSKNAVQSQFWPGFITSDTNFYYPWLVYKVQWLWLASHSSIMLHPLYLLFNLPGTFSSSVSAQLIFSDHSRPLAKYLPETSPLTVLR